jgi:hypothetical protein
MSHIPLFINQLGFLLENFMNQTELTIKPRAPRASAVTKAVAEGKTKPIQKQAFTVKIPKYEPSDIVSFVETNNINYLEYVARLINADAEAALRTQLADDEVFPIDQEIDVSLIDFAELDIAKLAELRTRSRSSELAEITEEDWKLFVTSFTAWGAEVHKKADPAANAKAQVIVRNMAEIISTGYRDIRTEQAKLEKVKAQLDTWFTYVGQKPEGESFLDIYEVSAAVYDKRIKTLAKKAEKTLIDFE